PSPRSRTRGAHSGIGAIGVGTIGERPFAVVPGGPVRAWADFRRRFAVIPRRRIAPARRLVRVIAIDRGGPLHRLGRDVPVAPLALGGALDRRRLFLGLGRPWRRLLLLGLAE